MKNLLAVFFLLYFFADKTFAQKDIKEYVKKNTKEIKTIQPDSLDFSDLEAIGNSIGNSRIVMLGEATHGDALTFLIKTRIVKYLHEKKGFNVLAFEGNFYSLNRNWDLVARKELAIDSFFYSGLHTVWTQCRACDNLLYNYIPEISTSSNPLIISGFDNQIFGNFSRENFKKDIDSFLVAQNIPFTKKEAYRKTFLPLIDSVIFYNQRDSTEQDSMISLMNSIENELMTLPSKNDFWFLCFQSLKQGILSRLAFQKNKDWREGSNIRDNQMANNLNWIVNKKYPNEKIIVWAQNGHIIKNPLSYHSMGEYFTMDSSMKAMTYVLGFTSRQGTFGNEFFGDSKVHDISKPMRFSLENWMPEKLKYGFVDFKKYIETSTSSQMYFYMKCLRYGDHYLDWTNGFDGIFYIKEMNPCIGFQN